MKGKVCACMIGLMMLLSPVRPGWCGSVSPGDCSNIVCDIRSIEHNDIHRNQAAEPYFAYIPGNIPILISAPHGAKHFRTKENRWKAEDAYTSALAIELGRLTGAHVLYLKNKAFEDPNNDEHTQYKDFLAKVVRENGIRFVMDLHGSAGDRPYKIDVGILDDRPGRNSCPTFRAVFEKVLGDFDQGIFNKRFRADDPCTITSFARNTLGIESAQIEINAHYRVVEDGSSAAA